jgi:VanZ family protein
MRFAKQWLPVILWAAVILIASDDSFSSDNSRDWLAILFGRHSSEALNYAVRKLAHVVEYAILGALALRAGRRATLAVAVAIAVALIDETRQSFTMARTGSVWDVLLDTAGACAAIALLALLSSRFRTREG